MEKSNKHPFIVCITGPMGAGKSSVTKALAEKFEKSAYIKVDHIRKMIVGGHISPREENYEEQQNLNIKNVCILTKNFLESGFNVFIDDVAGKSKLEKFQAFFPGHTLHIFLLLPSLDVTLERFHGRGGASEKLEKRNLFLHEKFSLRKDELDWCVIDSSNQTAEETVDEIFNQLVK